MKFEAPEFEVVKFELEDILTASGTPGTPAVTDATEETDEYWPYNFPDENCV